MLGFHRENQGNARDLAHLGLHDFFDGLPMGPFKRGELDGDGQFFSHAKNFTAAAGLTLTSSPLFLSRFDAPEAGGWVGDLGAWEADDLRGRRSGPLSSDH